MKNIIKYSFIALGLLFSALPTAAATGDVEGIVVDKTLTKKGTTPGLYTIRLETYVTGASVTTVTEVTEPVDIVMIIDRSVATNSHGLNDQVLDAAKDFVTTVYSLKPKDSNLTTHKLAMCSFGGGKQLHYIDYELAELDEATKNSMLATIETFRAGGSDWKANTCSDKSLVDAYNILSDVKNDGRKKIVLFFTAGAPKDEKGQSGTGNFHIEAGIRAINAAHNLKGGEINAKVYAVAPEDVLTADASPAGCNDVQRFCHYVSSNYDYSISGTTYNFQTNYDKTVTPGGEETAHDYYRVCKADGTDLSDIFKKIAEESTEGGSSLVLTDESCAVIDVMTSNFNFYVPEGATTTEVRCWPETCTYFNTTTKKGESWVKEGQSGFDYNPELDDNGNPKPIVATIDGNKLNVTGFYYSKDDEPVEGQTNQYKFGNWVGTRTKTGVGTVTKGNRLVVEFEVMLAEGYFEGMDLPSNDITSGVYYDTDNDGDLDPIIPYPVPVEHFPAICIMKDGMAPGESAIFDITGPEGFAMTVALKQMVTGNGALRPCYAIVSTPKMGQYTVTEKTWAWTYIRPSAISKTLGLITVPTGVEMSRRQYMIANGTTLTNNGIDLGIEYTQNGNTYCLFSDETGDDFVPDDPSAFVNSSIQLLFHFTNTPAKDGKPANDEAAVHNTFAGGSNTSSSSETGIVEEEDW